ncbi:hypothetical protein SAMN02745161_0838 [Halodesulfovibrio marinisediminis DSM 17456]|uniref:Uncharacterized protein n=1 Tax=Halodesulfovibrio marinisediminis DSM 17456 TaxID=1121457 RepID=A0A1N6EAM2_9BACT|nr:hypothetical protein SAMN02745161_0838 [Halodesulfovibrio marinisediminis DSM 17456]
MEYVSFGIFIVLMAQVRMKDKDPSLSVTMSFFLQILESKSNKAINTKHY